MTTLVPFVYSLLVAALLPGMLLVLALCPWRRLPPEPWTERARRLQPIRGAYATWVLVLPFAAVVARLRIWPDTSLAAVLVGTILGCALSGWPLDRAIFPDYRFKLWLKASAVHSVLRMGWVFLVLFFAIAMPRQGALVQLGWAAGFLVATVALSAGLLLKLLAALGGLRPAGDRLSSLVRQCAAEMNVTVGKIWEIRSPAAYAAAVVTLRELIFSTTTVADHDDEELRAICRHELAHLREGPAMVILRTARLPLTLLPFIFIPTLIDVMGTAAILPPLLIWMLLNRLFTRLSLRLEKRADTAARQDADSPAYARALERMHRRNLLPAAFAPKAARTHPDLYDRMLAAGVTPDYPRPAPPPRYHWMLIGGQILNIATVLGWMTYLD